MVNQRLFIKPCSMSIGSGKIIVEFFSAEIVFSVCRYRNCRAALDCAMTSAASFNDLDARCSPSAAITYKYINICYSLNFKKLQKYVKFHKNKTIPG